MITNKRNRDIYKYPLRLVIGEIEIGDDLYQEKLSCGHLHPPQYNGGLVASRRCRQCPPMDAAGSDEFVTITRAEYEALKRAAGK